MLTDVSSAFQMSEILVTGWTRSAAWTDAWSMGVLNAIVAGASTATPVVIAVVKAAWVSGTMRVGGLAWVAVGRTMAIAPNAITAPSVIAVPPRTNGEVRNNELT